MSNRVRKLLNKLTACILLVAFVTPASAWAAPVSSVQPCASDYLNLYSAYVAPMGSGRIEVWFEASGKYYLDEIGALRVMIYESPDNETWTWKKTFLHDQTPGMLSFHDNFHVSHVSYQGRVGYYYKAYVCIWGGSGGAGDTRYFWTSPKLAT